MMKLYKQHLLTDSQLKRLGDHKYSCTSASLCDPILQPWWTWLVTKTPIWLAPNLITIIGLLVNILTTLVLICYSPDAKGDPPRWACALCGLGLFVYQTLDAMDGKQARRTGTANPLGELFDHGCDSLSTVFVALSACIVVQLGNHPEWMFFQCFCAMTLFYCAHWQTYVSGTLRFGKVDVTEAQFTIIGIQMISAIFGPSIWRTVLFNGTIELWYGIPCTTFACGLWSLYNMLTVIFTGGIGKNGSTVAVCLDYTMVDLTAIFSAAATIYRLMLSWAQIVLIGGCGKNGSTVAIPGVELTLRVVFVYVACLVSLKLAYATARVVLAGGVGKNGSTVAGTSVLSPIIPFSTVLVPAFIIYRKSTEMVYESNPSLYILAFGFVAVKITNRLVVAHMTKSEMDYMDWSLLGPAMLFLNQYFNTFIPEYYVLWICLIYVTIDMLRYCYQICHEICQYLNVELFRIPYPGGPRAVSHHHVATHTSSTGGSAEKNGHDAYDKQPPADCVPLLLAQSEHSLSDSD